MLLSENEVSPHPVRQILRVCAIAFICIVAVYVTISVSIAWLVPHISYDTERWLAASFYQEDLEETQSVDHEAARERVQELVNGLIKGWKNAPPFAFKVYLFDDDVPNAFTLPGGYILVNTGLLTYVTSENELLMILGHELGHVEKRHH